MPFPSYITREQLAAQLPSDNLQIIDVRDEDYIGGHIRGAKNVPSATLEYHMPYLVRTLKDKESVVFHCALSQQRGPAAAQHYLNERERMKEDSPQKVYILDGGFTKWQEKYGHDEKLTEGYAADLWE